MTAHTKSSKDEDLITSWAKKGDGDSIYKIKTLAQSKFQLTEHAIGQLELVDNDEAVEVIDSLYRDRLNIDEAAITALANIGSDKSIESLLDNTKKRNGYAKALTCLAGLLDMHNANVARGYAVPGSNMPPGRDYPFDIGKDAFNKIPKVRKVAQRLILDMIEAKNLFLRYSGGTKEGGVFKRCASDTLENEMTALEAVINSNACSQETGSKMKKAFRDSIQKIEALEKELNDAHTDLVSECLEASPT